MRNRELFNCLFFWLIAALTFAGAVAWQMSTPFCSDDLPYSLASSGDKYSDVDFWLCKGGEYRSAAHFIEDLRGHFMDSNGRLTNIVYMLIRYMPLPAVKAICGLLVFGFFAAIYLFAVPRGRRGGPLLAIAAVSIGWLMFPWSDSMQSAVFIFNYPLPTVLLIGYIWVYRRADSFGRVGMAAFYILTVFVALFHESFTIPLGCFVFVDAILHGRSKGGSWRWVVWALLVICVISMFYSGSGRRMDDYDWSWSMYYRRLMWDKVKLAFGLIPSLLGLIALALTPIFRKRIPESDWRNILLPAAGAIVGGNLVCIVLLFFGRANWGADIFSAIIILRILSYFSFPRTAGRLITVGFIILYAWWLAGIVSWQQRTTAYYDAISRELSPRGSSPFSTVFVPTVHADSLPFYLLDIPAPITENPTFNNTTLARYWTCGRDREILILPERFRGIPADSMPAYPGNAHFRGEWPYIFIDRPFKGHLSVELGSYSSNANPLMPALASIKAGIFGGGDNHMHPYVETTPVLLPDSSRRHMILLHLSPRTFRHREIMLIDTIAPE